MEDVHYALLLLDNMPLQGHFVIAKSIGHLESEDLEEQLDYTLYKDLVMGKIIYPSSYEANEFINSEEYEKELQELKWISRKKISRKEAIYRLKKMSKDDILTYDINVYISKENKIKNYKANLLKHRNNIKKL